MNCLLTSPRVISCTVLLADVTPCYQLHWTACWRHPVLSAALNCLLAPPRVISCTVLLADGRQPVLSAALNCLLTTSSVISCTQLLVNDSPCYQLDDVLRTPSQYLCRTIFLILHVFDCVGQVGFKIRTNDFSMANLLVLFCHLLLSIYRSSFYRLVLCGWCLRTDRVSIALSRFAFF